MSDADDEAKTDPNPQRLLEAVLDKFDGALCKQGFEFREDRDWADFGGKVQALIFEFYDDLTGGDSDYDPTDTKRRKLSSSEEEQEEAVETSESESATLGSDSE